MRDSQRAAQRRRRRADPSEAEAALLRSVPDESLRRQLAQTLAESIAEAHKTGPKAWEVTLQFQRPFIHLNVGPCLVWSLQPDYVSVAILPSAMEPEAQESLKRAELGRDRFKVHRQLRLVRLPREKVPSLWPAIWSGHVGALSTAGGESTRSPYHRAHSPGVVDYLNKSLGLELAQPAYVVPEEVVDSTEALVDLIRQRYPGWDGFHDTRFVDEERKEKDDLIDRARELLPADSLAKLLEAADYQGFITKLEAIAKPGKASALSADSSDSGDLGILHRPDLDRAAFCRQVFDLLHGEDESSERLGGYLEWVSASGLPNKWPFPTLLLWASAPDHEVFVRPTVAGATIRLLGSDLDLGTTPSAEAYVEYRDLVMGLKDDLAKYRPRDVTDVQAFLSVAVSAGGGQLIAAPTRAQIADLLTECRTTYLASPKGQEHIGLYSRARSEARANFENLVQRHARGEDITDDILLHLLPHNDSKGNRERGAWRSWAPAVTKDVKAWFEGGGWAKPEDWPRAAQVLLRLVQTATANPEELTSAVQRFEAECPVQGLQAGLVTPILSALRPDAFLVLNKKSRRLINFLSRQKFGHSLRDYVQANRTGFELVEELSDLLTGPDFQQLDRVDAFDLFSHWLVAEKRFDFGKRRYWKIAPGEEAWQWDECRQKGFIAIGWDELGDLTDVDREALTERWKAVSARKNWKKGGLYQVRRLLHIQEGDVIVANHGTSEVLGIGTVTGPYYFQAGQTYSHRFPVEWQDVTPRQVSQPAWLSTVRELDAGEYEQIKRAPEIRNPRPLGPKPTRLSGHKAPVEEPQPPAPNGEYPLAEWARDSGFDEATLARWVRAIDRKLQAVFYGPPGTGKTFMAERLARHLTGGGDGFCELVQFHPSYAYEDFMQGIRPEQTPKGGLTYTMSPGRFLGFCEKARTRQSCCVLIIDEINRANLSRAFGELMYLLEYRGKSVPLAAGGEFSIPDNVRIIGTMNTADRSIALVDNALRRRFAFLALQPNLDVLETYFDDEESSEFDPSGLIEALNQVNAAINNPHYSVGISFFLRKDLPEQIEDIWRMEVEPYLEEYFFDQESKVGALRWDRLGDKILPSS